MTSLESSVFMSTGKLAVLCSRQRFAGDKRDV